MLRFEELPAVNGAKWRSLDNLPSEVWKDVPGYEGVLKVSCYSRVLRFSKKRKPERSILKQTILGNGYYGVGVRIDGKLYMLYVHRLVATAFINNDKNKPVIDHIDTNKLNNLPNNLRWATHKENSNNPKSIRNKLFYYDGNVYRRKRTVLQIDKNGEILNVYNSVKEASFNTGVSLPSISNVANGRTLKGKNGCYYKCRTAGGYRWAYL